MAKRMLTVLVAGALAGCGGANSDSRHSQNQGAAQPVAQAAISPTPLTTPESVDSLLAAANELSTARDLQGALRKLTEAIKQAPQRSDLYVKRAAIEAESRMFSTAILDMTTAIKLEPQNPKLLNTRGYFHLVAEQLKQAEQDFNDAIGLDLSYPQPYNNRGLVAIARKDFALAVKEFENALRIAPDYGDALNNRGFALIHLERYEDADASLTLAIKQNPKFLNAITNRARARMLLGRYEQAAEDFTAAIEQQPSQLSYYASRAEAWRSAGKEELAKQDAEHVNWTSGLLEINQRIAHHPQQAEPWVERGEHFLRKNDRVAARESFRSAIKVAPLDRGALLGLARLDMADKDFQKVVDACAALLKGGEQFEARSLRADAYLELGKLNEAIDDYRLTRRMDAQVISAYRQRAAQLRAAGNAKQSEIDERMAETLQSQIAKSAESPVIHAAAPEFPGEAALQVSPGNGGVIPASAEMPATRIR